MKTSNYFQEVRYLHLSALYEAGYDSAQEAAKHKKRLVGSKQISRYSWLAVGRITETVDLSYHQIEAYRKGYRDGFLR